jgi:hypothetical protein
MVNKQLTDSFELYTFTTYLYFFAFFILYTSEQSFLKMILYNTFGNLFLQYTLNYNILKFISHSYWKYHLTDIAMPQLITCGSNILINNTLRLFKNNYDYIFIVPSNIFCFYIISKVYKKEIKNSKNLRFIISLLYFFIRFIF